MTIRFDRLSAAALCLVILLIPVVLQAQTGPATKFIFPHFVSFPLETTGIAIFNPNPDVATVTLTLRGLDGQPVTGVRNPASLNIPARGQVAKTAGELFGTAVNLDASLEIWSSSPGLIPYYQTFDPAVTFLDGTLPPGSSTSLILPVIPTLSEGVSEIDLVNPSSRETAVELQLRKFDGALLGTALIQLSAGSTYRNLTQTVFPSGTDFREASHITAVSRPRNVLSMEQPVAGTILFAGFSSRVSPDGSVDLANLNAVPLTQTSNSGVIPYFHAGGVFSSTLALVNVEPANENVTVTAIANDGSTIGTQSITLKPQGGLRAPLQDIIPASGAGEKDGWILIQAAGRVTGAVIYGRNDTGSLTAVPMQRVPDDEFAFPQIVQGYGYRTDISLVNPASIASAVDVHVVGADGSTLAANRITIGPNARTSLTLAQLVPEVAAQWGGVLHIRADRALFATASVWSETGSIVSNLIPQDTAFEPSPLGTFAATGRVLINGQPAAGFRIALSGPISKLTTSREDGTYAFTNLSAGNYSMMVDQYGIQFVPAQTNFEITSASKRQDFQGFTSTGAILISPTSLPVGSPDTTIKIFGTDFNATSEAFAGVRRLQTTFVDPTQLQAVVPADMMITAANLEIAVVTDGSSASRRVSGVYSLAIYQDKPTLASVATTGIVIEGNPASDVLLRGTGFLKGANVKINGISDGIQVDVISDTVILASVPASYFAQGGIYPVTVVNPFPANVESNIQLLTVYYPAPAIDSILPKSCPAKLEQGAGPQDIEVFGYGFRRGAVVLFNETALVTTYCETDPYCLATHLYAKIPAELLNKAGFAVIEVQNPDPSLAATQVAYLRIDGLQPTITAVQPAAASLQDSPFDFTVPVIVSGTNFGPDTRARAFQSGAGTLPTFGTTKIEVLSSIQLVAWVKMKYPDALGEWMVEVANTPPGGGVSNSATFLITEAALVPNPFLISLSPQTVAVGGPSFTLTVNGINLKSGTVVYFNSVPLVTTTVSDRQVTAVIPGSLIRVAGKAAVWVTNPDIGGASNRLFLDVR